jgi:hypothetical protein
MAVVVPTPATSVWPSRGARAACAAPMAPVAPEMFSMITGCFQATLIRSASARATMSVAPPAGNGTMIRTVRSGNVVAPLSASAVRSAAPMAQRLIAQRAARARTCRLVMRSHGGGDGSASDHAGLGSARAYATRPQLRLRLRTSYGEARIVVKQRIL